MGQNQQYEQSDYNIVAYVLAFTGMVLFVLLLIGLFLFMVNRACRATGPLREPVDPARPSEPTEPVSDLAEATPARPLAAASASSQPPAHAPAGHPPAA